MQLRPYQTQFVEAVERGWKEYRKLLGVAPTGSGKTIVFSHLAKRLNDATGQKVLILAHREELIQQAIEKLNAATGIFAGKEKAEFSASLNDPVVVASIQTMIRRLDKWPSDHFGLIIVDEAHHVLADSYRKVLDHFTARVLGVTATPDRGDKKNLGQYFENIAHEISLIDLIKDGFLSPITIKSLPIQIDLNAVSQTAGDFDSSELGHALEPYLKQIAVSIKENVGNRKTLAFLPLIDTSMKFVEHCKDAGLTAQHIDGESVYRKEILSGFHSNQFQVLSNAMLLLEGYDEPDISCIAMLRPTRSRPLFAQAVGRGTRIYPGKENLLILDWLFLHERFKIVHPASLIADSEEEAAEMEALAEAGGGEELDLLDLQSSVKAEREQKLADKLAELSKRKGKFITAEQFALQHHRLEIAEWQPTMNWHSDPLTPKQTEWIEKAGVDPQTVNGKGQASQILDVYFKAKEREPASHKQRWVMSQHGWRSEDGLRGPFDATRKEATEFFANLKKTKVA